MTSISKMNLFIECFKSGQNDVCSCSCGKTYYVNNGLDEDYLTLLHKDTKAYEIYTTPTKIEFAGSEYVTECSCWHERAKHWILIFDTYRVPIVNYLKQTKRQAVQSALQLAVVDDVENYDILKQQIEFWKQVAENAACANTKSET